MEEYTATKKGILKALTPPTPRAENWRANNWRAKMKNFALKNDDGVTLQTVVLASVLALVATATGIVIYNAIKNKADDVDISKGLVDAFGFDAVNEDGDPASLSEVLQQTNPLVDDGFLADHEGVNPGIRTGSRAVQVSVGRIYTCALLENGTVKCWGNNDLGQLGDGSYTASATPVLVSGIEDVTQISVAWEHACAVLSTGGVKCWGDNREGELGNGMTRGSPTPVPVSDIDNAAQVSVGSNHSCALLSTGEVKCWGNNNYGKLGNGSRANTLTPVPVSDINNATQVSVGGNHSCALLEDKTVKCWGRDNHGLHFGHMTSTSDTPVEVPGIEGAIQISAGAGHTCAVLSTGGVKCWGGNKSPVPVSDIDNAAQVSVGSNHSCAVLDDGGLPGGPVKCWGGDNSPVLVSDIDKATQVSAVATDGLPHTCAVLESKTIKCWGANHDGQLGDRAKTRRYFPREVSTITGDTEATTATHVSAGTTHTCALLDDKIVKCWGRNNKGQLGNGEGGNSSDKSLVPVVVLEMAGNTTPLANVTQVSAGGHYDRGRTCAILEDNTVKCWGHEYGNIPDKISGIEGVTQISVGWAYICALLTDQTVKCWGDGYGNIPDKISGIEGVTQISPYGNDFCALSINKKVKCWTDSSSAVEVSGIEDVTQFSQSCAILTNKKVKCWKSSNPPPPSEISGITTENGPTQISAGLWHTCAILENGAMKCWGNNGSGQLGNGLNADSSTPVLVKGISARNGAVQISAGQGHTCALLENGAVKCWGADYEGQLGDG